jgi:nucleotide-binding universal stress UspA family protein
MNLSLLSDAPSAIEARSKKTETRHCSKGPILFAADYSDPESFPVRYVTELARALETWVLLEPVPDPTAYQFASSTVTTAPDAIEQDEMLSLIASLTDEHHPSMIVIASVRNSEESREALASLGRKISFKASTPVLLVGSPDERALRTAGHWHTVLAAVDFTPPSLAALLHAHSIAAGELIVLHCMPSKNELKARHWQEHLRMLAPFNESHTVPVQHLVQAGDVVEAILSAVRQTQADLVVLGSPTLHRQHVRDADSVVCGVVSRVRCPVLLMPPRRCSTCERRHPQRDTTSSCAGCGM